MSEPLIRDAMRVIQDLVIRSNGEALQGDALRELKRVLRRLAGGIVSHPDEGRYSEREVSVLFADLRGFSAIASSYPAAVVLGSLDRCFAAMVEIVERHYGTIDKFIGDAIMVIFSGDAGNPRVHARRAILCAVEMQLEMYRLRALHRAEGVPEMYLGIGISTGKVMAGLIGAEAYRAYTVIGEEVNIAARIEALSLRGQVLISEATYRHSADFAHVGEATEVHVKGRAARMGVREVLGIPALGKVVPRQDVRNSPRVDVRFDLDYWILEGKTVAAPPCRGTARNLGYHGLGVELAMPLPLHAELKLAFDLSFLGFRATDVYARIVSVRAEGERVVAGLEFTSVDTDTQARIELFVQMLLQGEYREIT